jgi:hypothetical protein
MNEGDTSKQKQQSLRQLNLKQL